MTPIICSFGDRINLRQNARKYASNFRFSKFDCVLPIVLIPDHFVINIIITINISASNILV